MKKFSKLIPAFCMLLISAMLMGTSTFAWFSMNTQVTATGMQVKAAAEGGIVITNSTKGTWSAEAAAHVTTASLFPASRDNTTGEGLKWYHNKSKNADDAAAGQESSTYETLSTKLSATTEGVGYVDSNSNNQYDAGTDAAYFLMNTFTIKSSGDTLTNTPLYINKVDVKSSDNLLNIDKALRVAIVVDSTTYIYAPVDGATTTYKVAGSSSDTTALTSATGKNKATSVTTIPNTDSGIPVSIYVYFEGEDAACKSTNISGITIDTLTVSVQFGTTTIS